MIDCPCGFGKNIREDQKTCPICGIDLTPLHRLNALPRAYFDEGTKLAEDNQLESAIERLTAAVALDPDFAEAHAALGNLYAKQGQFDEALVQYEKALRLDSENEEIKKASEETEKARKTLEGKRPKIKGLLFVIPVVAFLVGLAMIPLAQYIGKKEEPPVDYPALVNEIQTSLAEEPALYDLNLKITQTDTGLSISGKVPSDLHRKLICEMAKNVAGGEIENIQNLLVVPAAAESEEEQICLLYAVKPGECLSDIALRFYGDSLGWTAIYKANKDKITEPHKLSAGQILLIPFRDNSLRVIKGKKSKRET